MAGTPRSPTLAELDRRLDARLRRQAAEQERQFERQEVLPASTFQFASRVVYDLIAAVMISVAFGAAIDAAFDTWPWAILALFLLGMAAAVRTVYRTANRMVDAAEANDSRG